jgi:hypothetical protein
VLEYGYAKAYAVDEFYGEIAAAFFLQFLLAAVRRDALHEAGTIVVVEDLGLHDAHAATLFQSRRTADRDEQVGGVGLNDRMQQLVDLDRTCHRLLPRSEARYKRFGLGFSSYYPADPSAINSFAPIPKSECPTSPFFPVRAARAEQTPKARG